MNRLESPVLLQMSLCVAETCGSGYRDAADCGRQYLDIKTKKALGIYKNRYACVL